MCITLKQICQYILRPVNCFYSLTYITDFVMEFLADMSPFFLVPYVAFSFFL